jgi:phosphoribosylglycinamide formyltransferase-1
VHYATLEVDDGPVIAQEAVPVLDDDTVETLHERIKTVERRLYPEVLQKHDIDLVVMAGYGTIFGAPMFDAFPGAIINTHPALLPSFKGWHAVEMALDAGVKITGCTVHVATAEVDDGPILAQAAVPVLPDDTVETLHERIKDVERDLYVRTIQEILERGSVL